MINDDYIFTDLQKNNHILLLIAVDGGVNIHVIHIDLKPINNYYLKAALFYPAIKSLCFACQTNCLYRLIITNEVVNGARL